MVSFIRMPQEFHAGSKISADLSIIMQRMGHEYRYFPYININRNLRRICYPFFPLKYAFSFRRGDEVFIQYPFDMMHDAVKTLLRLASPLLKLRKVKSTAIVIDLESVRWNSGTDLTEDLKILNLFQKVIIHTPEMKQMLLDAGYKGEIAIMGLFDYLVSAPFTGERRNTGDICFAGNLEKSVFVGKLNDVVRTEMSASICMGKASLRDSRATRCISAGWCLRMMCLYSKAAGGSYGMEMK